MFKNLLNKEDNDYQKDDNELEEMYQRMYKKMARDFVHREDLKEILNQIFLGLGSANQAFAFLFKEVDVEILFDNAIDKAIEYRENLSKPRNKRKKYKDVDQ